MNSEEPFTSVNWDRDEPQGRPAKGAPETSNDIQSEDELVAQPPSYEEDGSHHIPPASEITSGVGKEVENFGHLLNYPPESGAILPGAQAHGNGRNSTEIHASESHEYENRDVSGDSGDFEGDFAGNSTMDTAWQNDNKGPERTQSHVMEAPGVLVNEGMPQNVPSTDPETGSPSRKHAHQSEGDHNQASHSNTNPNFEPRVGHEQSEGSRNPPEYQYHQMNPHTNSEDHRPLHRVTTLEISGESRMKAAFAKYSIDLHVTNPISDRDGNSKLFISYLVTTRTDHPDVLKLMSGTGAASSANSTSDKASGKVKETSVETVAGKSTIKVRRRYGDFRFLHDCLVSDFPQLLVPPLPAKLNFKYLTGDTFSTLFVHKRLHSLDRFVTFICQHKLLSQLAVFHYFISDSTEWASFTKNLKILKGEDGDGLIVGKVVNEDLLTETIMNFFTPSKHKRETNRDILEISDKLKKLYENLVKLERIFSKLNKKNTDLKNDYEQFLTQINKLASLQEGSSTNQAESGVQLDVNTSFASSIDASHIGAPSNFRIFSESLLFFLEQWAGLGRYIDESFLVSLKDCAKYIARLSSLIELHHNKQIDLQVLEDYLGKAKIDLANIGGHNDVMQRGPPPNPALISQGSAGGLVNNTTQLIKDTLSTSATPHIGLTQSEGKKQRLQQKITHLEKEIVAQTQLVNSLTSRIIDEEYPNWDRFNKIQLKQSMADLCDQEISFYKGLVDNWTDVEAALVQKLEELQ